MGTTVDDLQIKLTAEADKANKAIDNLIAKLGTLEEKISVFGKINNFGAVKSGAQQASATVAREMSKTANTISRYTAKMADKSSEHIAKLNKDFANLGKDFEKNGGFANLTTPKSFETAIRNYKVKIARAMESSEKADTQKGFDSAIKSVIEYTNILNSLESKLKEINVVESNMPRTWEERKAAIASIRDRVQSLTKEELEAATSLDKIRIRGVNDSNIADIEARISRINENLRGVDTGRFADYDAMGKALKEDLSYLQQMQSYIEQNMPQYASLIDNVGSAIERVNKDIENVLSKTGSGTQEVEKMQLGFYTATKEISGFVKMLENINIVKPREDFVSMQNEIEKTEQKLEKLYTQMERGMNGSGNDFKRTSTYKTLNADIQATEDHLKSLARQMDGMKTHEIDWGGIGSKIKESFGSAVSIVKNLSSHVFNLANALNKKIVGGFANLARNLNKTDDIAKKLFKSFTRVSNMLRLMITRMALRAVINETRTSFGELLQFSDKTAASFNKIRNAIKYLADTIVTLTAPILNASGTFKGLGNIIDMVSDKIVDLINKFNQLLSALLGHSTWIKATKQTKDYTKEVDKAGKAAKKALQPFDELNNLTSNDSGSGNDTGTGGSQFAELPIDDKWKNIAKWLKDMWKKSDFTELGALLGAKLRDALNSIPWGKIQNIARKLGSSLATLLNEFFRTEGLAKSIGNTIAQAINTGLIFAEEFIKKFDFAAFGKFIGDAIVTAIKNIHWQRFVDACGNLGKGIATAINSLVGTGVISEIGKAIGKVLLAAVNFAFNLVTNINFDELASEITNGIKNFLSTMNEVDKETKLTGWEKLGKTISDGLLGVLKIINTALGDKDIREQISKGITDMLNQIDFAGIIGQSAELIKNVAIGFANVIVAAFKSEEFRKGIATAIPYMGAAFAAVFASKGLASVGVMVGKNILKNISLTLVQGMPALGASISGALGAAATALGTSVGAILGALALVPVAVAVWVKNWDEIKEAAGLFAERTVEHWEELKSWFQTNMPYFSELVHKAFGTLPEFFNGIYISIKEKLALIKAAATGFIEGIKIGFSKALEKIKNDITAKIESAKTRVRNTLELIKNLIEGFSEVLVGTFNGNLIEISQGFKNCFDSIKKYITDLIDQAKTWGHNFAENIKTGIANNPIVIGIKGVVNAFRNNAEGGIYANHQWKPIQGYANGGVPKSAEMFLARENGAPELVGKMGSHTAVANNDQIVASVSDGVYRAVRAAMSGQQNNTNVSVELVGDTANLFKAIRKEGNDYQRRTGNPVWA